MLAGSHPDIIRAAATGLQTVLVTGATGFAGGHLVRRLQQLGHRVRALVRPHANVQPLLDQGIEIIEGDLTRAADVERAAEGARKIFHVAAVYRTAGHPDAYYYDVNVGGTENILAAACRQGVERVIHCSTVGVHGDVQEVPSTEDSPLNPGDIYQRTKLAGETAARDAFAKGLPGTIVRPAAIYGPGDLRLLKLFRTIQNGSFRMFGSGETCYHLVYIDDLVDGMLLCAERPEALGQVFILAGPRYLRLDEMVNLVADAVGVVPPTGHLPMWPLMMAAAACEAICRPLHLEPPLHRRRADFFRKNRAFSFEKAQRVLGYVPRIDPREGIRHTARWYFENGYLGDLARRAS
ncbi:MAG TPA: NAD-dependent epimerase/dehydratase family protein [Thermoanaerobaculia bacterium]|nr:NAD-dependent epimerase/dehydratase family protein [Thermoanaerobaculia bacterium]